MCLRCVVLYLNGFKFCSHFNGDIVYSNKSKLVNFLQVSARMYSRYWEIKDTN